MSLMRRFFVDVRATAVVEFALILPSLLFIIMIATDLFYLVRLHNDLENVVNLIADNLVLKRDITYCDLDNSYYFLNYIHRDRAFKSPVDENRHQLNIAIVEFADDAYDEKGDGNLVSGMRVIYSFSKGKLKMSSFYAPTGKIYEEAALPSYGTRIMDIIGGNEEFVLRDGRIKAIVVEAWARYDAYLNFVVSMPTLIAAGPAFTIHRGSSYSTFSKTVTVETDHTARVC